MPFNIGAPELVIILVIALLVLGPGKLPEVGSALGKGIREFRKAAADVKDAASLEPEPPTSTQSTATPPAPPPAASSQASVAPAPAPPPPAAEPPAAVASEPSTGNPQAPSA